MCRWVSIFSLLSISRKVSAKRKVTNFATSKFINFQIFYCQSVCRKLLIPNLFSDKFNLYLYIDLTQIKMIALMHKKVNFMVMVVVRVNRDSLCEYMRHIMRRSFFKDRTGTKLTPSVVLLTWSQMVSKIFWSHI